MDVKYRWLLSGVILACSAPLYAQDDVVRDNINHEFLYAQISAGSLNEVIGENSHVSAMSVGGNYLYTPEVLLTLDYEARFIHPDTTTSQLYSLLPGVAHITNIHDKLDIVAGAIAGILWASQTDNETDETLTRENRFVWGGNLALNYQLTERWKMSTIAEFRRSDILDEEIYTFRMDYHVSPRVSYGGFYSHRDKHIATINEGGISFRYYY